MQERIVCSRVEEEKYVAKKVKAKLEGRQVTKERKIMDFETQEFSLPNNDVHR